MEIVKSKVIKIRNTSEKSVSLLKSSIYIYMHALYYVIYTTYISSVFLSLRRWHAVKYIFHVFDSDRIYFWQ